MSFTVEKQYENFAWSKYDDNLTNDKDANDSEALTSHLKENCTVPRDIGEVANPRISVQFAEEVEQDKVDQECRVSTWARLWSIGKGKASIPVYEKDSGQCIRSICWLWITNSIFQVINLVVACISSFGTSRGHGWKTWTLWLMLINSGILCSAIVIGLIGIKTKSTKYLSAASITHYCLCCWSATLWLWDLFFILVFSANEAQHTSTKFGPKLYAPSQIAEFNAYVVAIILLDSLSTISSYFSGKKFNHLVDCYDLENKMKCLSSDRKSTSCHNYKTFASYKIKQIDESL